ncbi:MAG: O-antigen ligase family protein [Clostridia bacterium]|nr:O-antigen ligase family protein [Clostridia bacterium]
MENFNHCKKSYSFTDFLLQLKNFLYTKSYIAVIALICAFSYVSGLNLGCLFFLVIIGSVIIACSKDMSPVAPILFFIAFAVSNRDIFSNPLVFLIFAPAIVALIVRFIRFPIKKFSLGALTIPLILMLSAFILGGVRTENYSWFFENRPSGAFGEYIAIVVGLGVGMLFEYLMLRHGFSGEDTPKHYNPKEYIAYILVLAGILVGIELLFEKYIVNDGALYMGWGNTNLVGCVLLLSIPACWYMLVKSKNIYKVIANSILLALLYGFTLMTGSDGCFGVVLVFSAAIAVFTYFKIKKKYRTAYANAILTVALAIVLTALLLLIFNPERFNELINKLFSDTGRSLLYELAFEEFKIDKLFGVGLFHPFIAEPLGQLNYHSSFIHILATTGIYGLICFVIYTVARIMVVAKKNTTFNFYMLISFISYEAYASIDTGEFVMVMILVVGLIAFVEHINKLPTKEKLPLAKII